MMASGGLWVLVTLMASSAQTLRNAMQRDLVGALGAVGAAQVRFLFGMPFAVLFLAVMLAATGLEAPPLELANLVWTAFGAFSQVIATAMMLAAMRHAQLRRRRRLHQDRAGAGRAFWPRRVQRDADPLADRGDRAGVDRRRR